MTSFKCLYNPLSHNHNRNRNQAREYKQNQTISPNPSHIYKTQSCLFARYLVYHTVSGLLPDAASSITRYHRVYQRSTKRERQIDSKRKWLAQNSRWQALILPLCRCFADTQAVAVLVTRIPARIPQSIKTICKTNQLTSRVSNRGTYDGCDNWALAVTRIGIVHHAQLLVIVPPSRTADWQSLSASSAAHQNTSWPF